MVSSRNNRRRLGWWVGLASVTFLLGGAPLEEAAAQSGSRSVPSRSSGGSARRSPPSRAPVRTGRSISRGSINRSVPRVSVRNDRVNAKLVSVNHNGVRSTILLQDQRGNRTELALDSKVDFSITRKSDPTALSEGQFVSVQVKRYGSQTLAQRVVIHIDSQGSGASTGNRPPTGSNSRNSNVLFGQVVSVNPATDESPDSGSINLQVGPHNGNVKWGRDTVVVAQSRDPRLAEPGASVLVDGLRSSNGNFSVRVVSIERKSPFPTET